MGEGARSARVKPIFCFLLLLLLPRGKEKKVLVTLPPFVVIIAIQSWKVLAVVLFQGAVERGRYGFWLKERKKRQKQKTNLPGDIRLFCLWASLTCFMGGVICLSGFLLWAKPGSFFVVVQTSLPSSLSHNKGGGKSFSTLPPFNPPLFTVVWIVWLLWVLWLKKLLWVRVGGRRGFWDERACSLFLLFSLLWGSAD